MRTLIGSSILFLSAAATAGAPIERVVVFADRADVTRAMKLSCDGRAAAAVFEGLPAVIDTRTLRARTRAAGRAIGISSETRHQVEAVSAAAAKLDAELREVGAERATNERAQGALRESWGLLDGYGRVLDATLDEAVRSPKPATGAWAAALDAFRDRRFVIGTELAALAEADRKLARKQDLLARRRARLGDGGERSSLAATVAVDCEKSDAVEVLLSYVVPGATWRPEYDVDFAPSSAGAKVGKGEVRLTVSAVVQQSTGEDWTNVSLALSTAKPRLGAEAPYPAPLMIGGDEKDEGKVLVQAHEKRDSLAAGGGGGERGPESAALEDKGQSVLLSLPRRVSIAADGRPYWSPVDVIEAKAESKLVAVPKLREYVYQLVSMKNPAAYPLLAGRVHSFRRGVYVGDSALEYRGVGEPMEISLGIDEELRVRRNPVEDQERKAGLFSSTKRIVQELEIELVSRARGKQSVELRETIPVSKIDDVKVELDNAKTTPGYALDPERGFLTWQVELAEGASRKLGFGYTIKLPEDWAVQ